MPEAFRIFPGGSGVVSFFIEASGEGDIEDIDSLRNRPAASPQDWLGNIRFHSDLDYMEVSTSADTVISHPYMGAGTMPSGATLAFGFNYATYDYLLATHSLGYEPFFLVSTGTNILWPGIPVHVTAGGGARFVTAYATTTQIRLYEYATTGIDNMSAISKTYSSLVFKNPPSPSGDKLMEFDPSTGAVSLAKGKIDTSRRYLSVVPGGSPLGFSYGRTIDLNNGAPRAILPDGTTYDPIPSTSKLGILRSFGYPTIYGSPMSYNGSFTAPPTIQVQAP